MPKSLVSRIRLVYLPFDVLFAVLIPLAVVNAIDPADTAHALLVLYGLSAARLAVDWFIIGRIFGPAAHWLAIAPAQPDPRELREADEGLRNGPRRFTAAVMITWVVQLFAAMVILLFVDKYRAGIAPRSVIT